MKPSGRWKRQNPCCPQSTEAQIPKISYFQHMYGERNGDMTPFGGVNSSLCFRKHPSGYFITYTTAISAFHLGLFTMC